MIIVLHPANAREECIGEGRLVTDSHHNVKHWRTRSRRYERRERVDARPQQGSRSGNSVSPVGSAEVCKPDTGRCGGCGSCAAPGGGSLKHSAGGLGSRPGGTGLSPRRAEHPDRPDGGPALRSAEVALGRLAADGALEPEVTLVGWRTALTDDASTSRSRCRQALQASGPGADCPGRASLASIIPGPGPRSRLSWTARLREEGGC